jgi:hypothetical protein
MAPKPLIASLLLLTLSLFTSGCATITRGSKDVLVVESTPSGADVSLSSGQAGKTPASFKLPRADALVVTISKAGYETVTVNVTPHISGAGGAGMAGNVLLGGLVGAAVDAGTGAMKDLKPNPVQVTLVKLEQSPNAAQVAPTDKSLSDKLRELKVAFESGLLSKEEYEQQRAKILKSDSASG